MQCTCNIYMHMYMMQCPHQQCLTDAQKQFCLLAMLFAKTNKQTNKKLGQSKYISCILWFSYASKLTATYSCCCCTTCSDTTAEVTSKRTIPIFPPNMLVKLTQAKHHWYIGGKDLQCFLLPAADVLLL